MSIHFIWNTAEAAYRGDLDKMITMHNNGRPWNPETTKYAAMNRNIECLKYAHEHGCPWDPETTKIAAMNGDIECLKYAHEHGCPWDPETTKYANLDCIKYAHEHGIPWYRPTTKNAASYGQLEYLKYAHEHGCPWDESVTAAAAKYGQLECLKYAHEHGCPWDSQTTENAAYNGKLYCLKYAHEHGCPWDIQTTKSAAYKGHLECLKYAYEHDCPWNESVTSAAANYGQLECLKYAYEHGCPWGASTTYAAAYNGHLECLKYALKNNCPFSKNMKTFKAAALIKEALHQNASNVLSTIQTILPEVQKVTPNTQKFISSVGNIVSVDNKLEKVIVIAEKKNTSIVEKEPKTIIQETKSTKRKADVVYTSSTKSNANDDELPVYKLVPVKRYKKGYQSTNPANKDQINDVIQKECVGASEAIILLDHVEFKSCKSVLAGNSHAKLFIPQYDRETYEQMRAHEEYGKYVHFGSLQDLVETFREKQDPISIIYADFTCAFDKAESLLETLSECVFTDRAVIGVTITLRNANPIENELGDTSYTNQDVVRLVNTMYILFEGKFISIIESGAAVYGTKARMATVLFKRK